MLVSEISGPKSERNASHTVTMMKREWQVIDAVLDNEVDMAIMNGDPRQVVALGESIRQAGWDQVAGDDWPPDNKVQSVTLTDSQWKLVTDSLDRWAATSESIGQVLEAQLKRDIHAVISAQLTGQP